MSIRPIVDVDDRGSWPAHVNMYAEQWAERLRGTTKYTGSLDIPLEQEGKFCQMFEGYLVRAYHCTRLMDQERDGIYAHGLRIFTADLMTDRIKAAHAAGEITAAECERYLRSHAFASVDRDKHCDENRAGQVCLIVSRTILDHLASGVTDLLDTWGGRAWCPTSDGTAAIGHVCRR